MKRTTKELSNIATDVLHAAENEKNIYHPVVLHRSQILKQMFGLGDTQLKEKIQALV